MKNKKYFFSALAGWTLVAVFAIIIIVNGAWTTPTANPPGSNLSTPINVGSSNQTKTGSLSLGGALSVASSTTMTGSALFQSTATFTPLEDNANQFKITNATGTELFKINSTDNTSTLTGGGTSLVLNASGAGLGNLNIGSDTMNFGTSSGYKFGVGVLPTTDNLEVIGTIKSSGNISSTTGFCIGASCITEWPTGGSGGESVPATGMILSSQIDNPIIVAAGYTMVNLSGLPLIVTANAGGTPMSLFVYEKNP